MNVFQGPLRTLFLDAGGVLLYPNWDRISAALARAGVQVEGGGLAAAEPRAKRALDDPDRIRATDDAARVFPYFDRLLEGAGVRRTPGTDAALAELRAYHDRYNLWENPPAEVVPALRRFQALGLTLAVVSNANGRLRAVLDRLGLTPFFRTVVDSDEEGVEKPDPRIFQIALARSGGQPATTLHVGDLYNVDVVGARAAGLRAVLLDVAGLYADHDCPRVSSLSALAQALEEAR